MADTFKPDAGATRLSRRGVIGGAGAMALLAGCANPIGGDGAARLDARVDATRNFLLSNYPGMRDVESRAQGVLYMPLITEAGFGLGGAYGHGALRINNVTVDYYSAARATLGFQIGAQQYAHVLFFMSAESLNEFRRSEGWAVSADVRYAVPEQGAAAGLDSVTQQAPVIAVIFGQSGLIAGATLGGTKYTRIIP